MILKTIFDRFLAKQSPKTKKMAEEENIVRMDKWLWAARLFKTRSLAADAIKGGKVKVDDSPVKPSREVKVGDVIQVQIEQLHKVVEVKTVVKNRVSAKQVPEVYNDLTPKEEYERIESGATAALADLPRRNDG